MTPEEVYLHLEGRVFSYPPYGRVALRVGRYDEGHRVAIEIVGVEDIVNESVACLTVNIPQVFLEPGEILVKTWAENEQVAKVALTTGLFEDTGKRVQVGYVEAQVWRIP